MAQSKIVVIVARTHMHHGRVCVGAIDEQGESVRLLNAAGLHDLERYCTYQVGEKWLLTYSACGERKPPHLEDVAVRQARKLGTVDNVVGYILQRAKPWAGGINVLFEGKIRFTQIGAGYIDSKGVPSCSTGFWIPFCDLKLSADDRGKSGYYALGDYRHLRYVGVREPIERIDAKRLVRVSLARWWRPEDVDSSLEERCYAQLSGWF